ETNEIDLQQEMQPEGMLERYEVKLNLAGCGDGEPQRQTGRNKIIATQSALLYNREGGLPPEEQMVSNGKVVLHHGRNQLLYYLNKNQRQALTSQHVSDHIQIVPLTSNSLLHLILGYE
ncbi:pilus-assembly fibrillin subunit, partial [Yersinia enterocolitica]|uniref:pilus-assembly fibrillin subunit n=1 Tax=Yersinia enterocolitica TaxID=630 RepID=UPI0027E56538